MMMMIIGNKASIKRHLLLRETFRNVHKKEHLGTYIRRRNSCNKISIILVSDEAISEMLKNCFLSVVIYFDLEK